MGEDGLWIKGMVVKMGTVMEMGLGVPPPLILE